MLLKGMTHYISYVRKIKTLKRRPGLCNLWLSRYYARTTLREGWQPWVRLHPWTEGDAQRPSCKPLAINTSDSWGVYGKWEHWSWKWIWVAHRVIHIIQIFVEQNLKTLRRKYRRLYDIGTKTFWWKRNRKE